MVYQPLYWPDDWSGDLLAYTFDTRTGTFKLNPPISAGQKLDARDWERRNIITISVTKSNGTLSAGDGIPFKWSSNGLSDYQKEQLNKGLPSANKQHGKAILEYLRGSAADESNGLGFRNRHHSPAHEDIALLGDIIHSSPVYVGPPSALYDKRGYNDFKAKHADRTPMVYVGANDGMLHAFKANTLKEAFAYVPATLIPKLEKLSDPNYNHQYYVDGTPTIGDAYFIKPGESAAPWHTVLVGTTGAGGKSVFALDVTSPSSITENNAAQTVLWEINPQLDNDYKELGYTFSRPAIVQMATGRWAAVFGNGPGSDSGMAVLYIADIATGKLIRKFVLADGLHNGLSTPIVTDLNGDHVADRIYAGDVKGNLWVIDVSSDNKQEWGSAFGGSNPVPLFTATAPNGKPQPITVRPEIVFHPKIGQVVLFGTGRCFNFGGTSTWADTQSFYGIWDSQLNKQPANISRTNLVEQTITQAISHSGVTVRTLSSKPIGWNITPSGDDNVMGWYIDFDTVGERIVDDPVVRPSRLTISTLIRDQPSCLGSGDGWLMRIDPVTGSRLGVSPFDSNGDGIVDADDYATVKNPDDPNKTITIPASGIRLETGGIPSTPATVINPDTGIEYNFVTLSKGVTAALSSHPEALLIGRQSWHQLK